MYTSVDSSTVFERRTFMEQNVGGSGGAIYNEGTTTLENAGFFRANEAAVRMSTVCCWKWLLFLSFRNCFCFLFGTPTVYRVCSRGHPTALKTSNYPNKNMVIV